MCKVRTHPVRNCGPAVAVTSPFRFIQPCSPVMARSVPAGDGWLHSRRGNDWTKRLLLLAEALTAIPAHAVILDAELCLLRADGSPDFYRLQAAIGGRQHEPAVFGFDLLHLDGEDLRSLPLLERRRLLERLLRRAKVPCLHLVEAFDDGQALLEVAERHRLEGVVSKRRDAPYRSGECRDWRKVKTQAWREANRERWRLFEKVR